MSLGGEEGRVMDTKKKIEPADLAGGDRPYYDLFPEDDYAGEAPWTPLDPSKVNVRVYSLDASNQQAFLGRHPGTELPDETALGALYGGGKFHLVAVWSSGKATGQVARRRTVKLPGEPRGAQAALVLAAQPAPVAAAAPSGKSGIELAITVATIVLPAFFTYMQHLATMAQQQRATDATLAQQQQQAQLDQQKALFSAMTEAFAKVQGAPAPTPPATPPATATETLKETVALMKELGFKREESDAVEEILKGFLPVIAMRAMGGGPMLPPGALGGAPALIN